MPCFYLSFSRGLEKFVYEKFGEYNMPKGDYFYPDAYSLLFTAADLNEAKRAVQSLFPHAVGQYDRYLLFKVPQDSCYGEQSGLECRQWLERHGISI